MSIFASFLTLVAQAATKAMVKQGIKGKIVFCSSILGYFSMVGYSTYSPGKFAIRGARASPMLYSYTTLS